jgi:glycine/serine hydroxymethyltransferase
MGEAEMRLLAGWIVDVLAAPGDEAVEARVRERVERACAGFAVPGLSASTARRAA